MRRVWAVLMALALLAGCGGTVATITPASTQTPHVVYVEVTATPAIAIATVGATATSVVTSTPRPTVTPTAIATATVTNVPTATATEVPTPTIAPTNTPQPTATAIARVIPTATISFRPTPSTLTIADVIKAWRDAGLKVEIPGPYEGIALPTYMQDAAGLLGYQRFGVNGGLYIVFQFATPAQADAARGQFTNQAYSSYREEVIVLTISNFSPNLPTHLAVLVAMR